MSMVRKTYYNGKMIFFVFVFFYYFLIWEIFFFKILIVKYKNDKFIKERRYRGYAEMVLDENGINM